MYIHLLNAIECHVNSTSSILRLSDVGRTKPGVSPGSAPSPVNTVKGRPCCLDTGPLAINSTDGVVEAYLCAAVGEEEEEEAADFYLPLNGRRQKERARKRRDGMSHCERRISAL